jgi:hypothetical protein
MLFAYFSVNSAANAVVGTSPAAVAVSKDAFFKKERRDCASAPTRDRLAVNIGHHPLSSHNPSK